MLSTPRPAPRASENGYVLSEDQFRRFAARLSQIVWRMSVDGRQIIAPRWAELTGRPEHMLQGSGWVETIAAADRAEALAELRTALMYKSHFQADFRLCLRDGSQHWYRARGEPVCAPNGEVAGWIGIANNIDEQKTAEEGLLVNEARLRMLIDAARVGTIEHDIASDRIKASSLALRLIGYDDVTELSLGMMLARVHPDDRDSVRATIDGAMEPTGTGDVELLFRSLHPDGRIVWISARGRYVFDGSGTQRRAVRFIGVAGDVTGRLRDIAERARLSSVITSTDDAVIALDLDANITHWNPGAERMYGHPASAMVGKSIFAIVPPERVESSRANIAAVLGGEAVPNRIVSQLRADGQVINAALTLSPIRDEAGRVIGLSSIARDVTQQQRLEQEVAEAQKMEAVGLLAGGVAHDLNNSLTAILAVIELASTSSNIDGETREHFIDVRKECLRGASLIRQLLTVARRQVINPRTCDVNRIVRDATPLIERILGEDVFLELDLRATHPVFADVAQIEQVLLNLVVNAREAMPNGGTVRLETRDDDANNSVVLRVIDSGVGMTAEVKTRLFEPFFTTKGVGQGAGLGLSTSYGIIAQAGGTMSVESEVGQGAGFTIRLPALPGCSEVGKAGVSDDGVTGDDTILVVEDERGVRDAVVRSLRRLGYNVLEGRNGADALDVIADYRAPVHLLITDVVMPEMSGPDLVASLRGWYPGLRVLFMSGYSPRAVESCGAIVAETTLLAKPFEMNDLVTRVRELLDEPATQGRSGVGKVTHSPVDPPTVEERSGDRLGEPRPAARVGCRRW